jgi:hypothetical protein
MELKTIFAIVLCLVIVGGAVYLHIKRKKIKRWVGRRFNIWIRKLTLVISSPIG